MLDTRCQDSMTFKQRHILTKCDLESSTSCCCWKVVHGPEASVYHLGACKKFIIFGIKMLNQNPHLTRFPGDSYTWENMHSSLMSSMHSQMFNPHPIIRTQKFIFQITATHKEIRTEFSRRVLSPNILLLIDTQLMYPLKRIISLYTLLPSTQLREAVLR